MLPSDSAAQREPFASGAERGAALALAGVLVVAALWAGLWSLSFTAFEPGSDEGVYRHYMRQIHEQGLGAYPGLMQEFIASPERWTLPPPLRVLHVLACALVARLVGPSFEALLYVSFASHVASVLASFALSRRRLGVSRAALLSAALACSPLLLRLGVLPLSDATGFTFGALAFWSFLDLLDEPRRARWWRFTALFALAIAAKELNGLLAGPFLVIALVEGRVRGSRLHLRDLLVALALPHALVAALWMLVGWSPTAAFQVLRLVLESTATNAYMLEHNTGPWWRYIADFALLSPLATALALVCAVVACLRRTSFATRAALVLGAVLLLEASFFGKNARYFPLFELPLRIATLELAWLVAARSRLAAWFALAALAALAALDLWDATNTFRWLHDPIHARLLELRGLR